jgi:hybrid cluster-associated redox disulfide protein
MKSPSIPYEQLSLSMIMDRWPGTITVFLHYRFICVGCVIAPYHSLKEACSEHGADINEVCAALDQVIRQNPNGREKSGPAQDD